MLEKRSESTGQRMERYLDILEVSQKQAYIFSSNKLKDNILRSSQIADVTSLDYLRTISEVGQVYFEEKNYVYAGGGHTILEFSTREAAVAFNRRLTFCVHKDYPGMELFVAIRPYDFELPPGDNLMNLTKELEKRKSKRRSAFHQGSFGIERINSASLEPELWRSEEEAQQKSRISEREKELDKLLIPQGYKAVSAFEELGTSKGNSSFIAVVHIDGNGMGKRVSEFYENHKENTWQQFRKDVREFSDGIDKAFKTAFAKMNEVVAQQIERGILKDLNLDTASGYFPIRRIISSGDDICFVAEGRIGIEAAVTFLNALAEENTNGKGYTACAGVALVHQKYPFFKAYELAEMLCSNAKKFGAELGEREKMRDGGSCISAIDWHIEQGEIQDSFEEIRSSYAMLDGGRMELRPLIVKAPEQVNAAEPFRQYRTMKKLLRFIKKTGDENIRGKLKKLRDYLKQGEKAANYYIEFQKLGDIALNTYQGIFEEVSAEGIGKGQGLERKIFLKTSDGCSRSTLFDAVEIMDTYIPFEDGGDECENKNDITI